MALENESSILIIDDSSTNIRLVSNMVEHLGHKIHIAKNGVQALKLLTQLKPDVILMDIQMPHMDGFECCQRIKSVASRATIPVIFMSGSHDEDDIGKARLIGAQAYVTKPINPEALIKEINFHLS
ncbi:response regulator [Thalassotalea fusca]